MKSASIKTNFVYNAFYQVMNIIVPLVTLPYLSRVLKADGLGSYSFAYSVAYYFYMFIKLGLDNYGNRTIAYVKDDEDKLSTVFFEIYVMQLCMGAIISSVYLLYCVFASPNKLLAFIFFLVVISGCIDLTWMLHGLEEFKVTSIRDTCIKVLTAICIFIFVREACDVWKYALIYCVGFNFSQLISLAIIKRKVHYSHVHFHNVLLHIKPNLILFLPTIAVSIYKVMDKIMLGAMAPDSELGYYHGAENVILVPLAFVTALGTVMLPRMTNMLSKNEDETSVKKLFNKSIMFSMFISTSLCMGIMTVAREFVPLFFGKGFDKCITIFYIILPSCIFLAFANVIRTQFLLPRKRDTLYIISLFAGATVNFAINILLIPHLASIGAAIGTLVAEIMVCVIQSVYVFKEADIGMNIISSIPFVLAGIIMFVAFHNYTPHVSNAIVALLIKILIGGVGYVTALGIALLIKRALSQKIGTKKSGDRH